MIKKLTDVAKCITWIIAAVISVLSLRWYWDIFKPSKKEETTEENEYVED